MPATGVKRYSLLQRSVRLVQTSLRRLDRWASVRVPGLPNPPEIEDRLRKPRFVDLWELSFADHRRIFHEVWQEYKASFVSVSDEDLQRSKDEVKRALRSVRGQVSSSVGKNISFLDKSLEGTRVHDNLQSLGEQGAKNVKVLSKELQHVADGVDTDAMISRAQQMVNDSRSKDDVTSTLKKNVKELHNLANESRDAALRLESKDVDNFKASAQSWFADKLMVGQSVLMAFIEGYRSGKMLEMEREDALLVTFVKQAAEDHKDIIENQMKFFLEQQQDKQIEEPMDAPRTGHSVVSVTVNLAQDTTTTSVRQITKSCVMKEHDEQVAVTEEKKS
ncbi:hypothetical protein CCR75_002021 [Bremia lactucae]|uniref:Uncharacterized protein n=1 Tax=Bremia lactucae TaxID=4779 RepID=A0A976FG51_BRELC|nr:hypothetical protein CCR75_002021 [Bremia lactucae]